jgi:hypothetical protein
VKEEKWVLGENVLQFVTKKEVLRVGGSVKDRLRVRRDDI